MARVSRRSLLAGTLPVAAGLAVRATPATPQSSRPRMVLGCQRAPTDDRALMFFKRHGVEHICGYPDDEDAAGAWSVEGLTRLKERCAVHGVALDMVQFPFMSSDPIDSPMRKAVMTARSPRPERCRRRRSGSASRISSSASCQSPTNIAFAWHVTRTILASQTVGTAASHVSWGR